MQDRYSFISLIGSGGMGKVFLAHDNKLNRMWAVKEIASERIQGELLNELRVLKSLDHKCLPRIVDYYEKDGNTYLVMDYVRGITLKDEVKNKGFVSESRLIEMGIALSDALVYLHERDNPIIYRDMKPENIILKDDGSIMLVDFGASVLLSEINKTYSIGTRKYAAPEQLKGIADEKSDIYGLGKTLEFALDKEKAGIGFLSIIAGCIREKPEERYKKASFVKNDLIKLKSKKGKNSPKTVIAISMAGLILLILLSTISGDKKSSENVIENEVAESIYEVKNDGNHAKPLVEAEYEYLEKNDDEKKDSRKCYEKEDEIIALHNEAVDYLFEDDVASLCMAMNALEKEKGMIEEMKCEGYEKYREYEIENLSMLSTIYRHLGKREKNERDDYYRKSEDCILKLLLYKEVKESDVYELKVTDLVNMKDELGDRKGALECLENCENEKEEISKEIYYTHALMLLENDGNKEALESLFSKMKEIDEVKNDFRYKSIEEQIKEYCNG